MAIVKKASEYQQIINQLDLMTDNNRILLKKLHRNEIKRAINFYGANITLILTIWISLSTKSLFFIFGVLGMPIGATISIYQNFKANALRSDLDNNIFNDSLINKIKIFYPKDDTSNLEYTQIKQISVKTSNTTNEHQAIIELAYQAYKENATGIIVTDSNQSNVVTSTIDNKAGATAITKTFYSASAMLIKDIQNSSDKQLDLEHWYSLFEKGMINEEEYNQKKEDILNNC